MSPTEDLSLVTTMDLVNRLADPNEPHATLDEDRKIAGFEFSSSHSPKSPLAEELKVRPGIKIVPDLDSELSFVRFKVEVALDHLRPQDIDSIRTQIADRSARALQYRALPSSGENRVLMPPDGC